MQRVTTAVLPVGGCCEVDVGWSPATCCPVVASLSSSKSLKPHRRAQQIGYGLYFRKSVLWREKRRDVQKPASDLQPVNFSKRTGNSIIQQYECTAATIIFDRSREATTVMILMCHRNHQWLKLVIIALFKIIKVFIQFNCFYTIVIAYYRRNIQISCITMIDIDKQLVIYLTKISNFNCFKNSA